MSPQTMTTATTSKSSQAAQLRVEGRRLLMLTHRVPFPPDRGDRIRSWNILKHLANLASVERGHTGERITTSFGLFQKLAFKLYHISPAIQKKRLSPRPAF